MNKAQSDIEGIYGKGEICMSEGKCLALEPGIIYKKIIKSSGFCF